MYNAAMILTHEEVDFDYSYYLGPNYKDSYPKEQNPATWVCNHSAIYDIIAFISTNKWSYCSFIAADYVGKVPFLR